MATQICRGFTDEQWKVLRTRLIHPTNDLIDDESAWACSIEVFKRRIEERFISPIEALERCDSRKDIDIDLNATPDCWSLPPEDGTAVIVPGFAIMAICCLLIETLHSFREKRAKTTKGAFECFLRRSSFNGAFEDKETAKAFVCGVRDGILHDAETRQYVIWRDEPAGKIVAREGHVYNLNRTALFDAIKTEFRSYLIELRAGTSKDLRLNFIEKMDAVVDQCDKKERRGQTKSDRSNRRKR